MQLDLNLYEYAQGITYEKGTLGQSSSPTCAHFQLEPQARDVLAEQGHSVESHPACGAHSVAHSLLRWASLGNSGQPAYTTTHQ